MKKLSLNPLALDKETIALLDTQELQAIAGGKARLAAAGTTSGCGTGTTDCSGGGSSSSN